MRVFTGLKRLHRLSGPLLLGASGLFLLLLSHPGVVAQPAKGGEAQTVRGVVERFTTAKKGEVDGAVLDNGTWVHWPPHLGAKVAAFLAKNDRIRVTGRFETGKKGERKFEAEAITNLRTNESLALRADTSTPGDTDARTVRGTVERFTTAPKGEIDGAVLDDGTWIHWPPHLQDRVTNFLARKDRIRVTGRDETGPKGDRKFEAQTITNVRTGKSLDLNGPGFGGPTVGQGGDREQRLRALEQEMEQLLREIQRLRKEK